MTPHPYTPEEIEVAMRVLANKNETYQIGEYTLHHQDIGDCIWGIYDGLGDDATLLDTIRSDQFASGRQLLNYLCQLNYSTDTKHGDVPAPEVA